MDKGIQSFTDTNATKPRYARVLELFDHHSPAGFGRAACISFSDPVFIPEESHVPFSSLSRSFVAELSQCVGQRVKLHGFAEAIRDHKRIRFIILRDATGKVQLTQSKDNTLLTDALDALTPESALIVTGTVVAAPSVKLDGLEISLESVEICGLANPHYPSRTIPA